MLKFWWNPVNSGESVYPNASLIQHAEPKLVIHDAAEYAQSPYTNIVDFRGFDSSMMLI